MAAASNGSEYFEFDVETGRESFARPSNADTVEQDEEDLRWAAIGRLPSQRHVGSSSLGTTILRRSQTQSQTTCGYADGNVVQTIDVKKLDRADREMLVRQALATSDQDNYKLLSAIKERLDRVGMEVPKIEVRFENLNIEADVQAGTRALPTLVNVSRDFKTGNITYNGENLDEFHVKRTSAYISQTDNHIAELTVRETLDFAARCQGANEGFAGYMKDLTRLEKERGIRPSSEIDAFMKAASVKGEKHSVSTDYVLRVLGLDVCSDTIVGNDMMRGVSGGQRKRVTTGEMTVGPRKTLFMDEISTGLDSSTTFQIVKCIRNFVHLMDATVLMALLQPAPETFDLFDDLILLSEGYMVYQGPRQEVVGFFESLGFRLPPRKGVADFLQEVTSKKDQAQYWADPSKPYQFIPVSDIAAAFRNSQYGHATDSKLATPFDKSSADPSALCRTKFAISGWENLKACFEREILLINRHRFLYTFRTCQVAFVGFVTATVFLRTRLHPTNEQFGNEYLSCLFFGLVHMMFNGFSELPLMISRLPVFYKQRDNSFHPAWSWSIASWLLRVPYSVLEAVVWTCVVYYSVGLAPSPGRFFRYMLLLFSVHQMALGLFRMMASLARDMVIANTFGSAAILIVFLLGGFVIPKADIKPWWVWGFWVSPLSYGQRAIAVNEFTATRWMTPFAISDTSIGFNLLKIRSFPTNDNWYWVGIAVLIGYAVLFNNVVTLALAYLNPLRKPRAVVLDDPNEETKTALMSDSKQGKSEKKGMILPFQPLTMTFHNVNYYVDMPKPFAISDTSIGFNLLKIRSFPTNDNWYWVGIAVLIGYAVLFNNVVTLALAYLNPLRKPRAVVLDDPNEETKTALMSDSKQGKSEKKGMILPFQPLTMTFHNVNYYVDMPKEMRSQGVPETRLQLLTNVSGVFSPGVLTALVGSSGAGKTTLMDVLADYFQGIHGVPAISSGYNPATWMLEVTTPALEEKYNMEFADLYKNSDQFRGVETNIKQLSVPPEGSEPISFTSRYSQSQPSQFLLCLWKQNLVYWRSPEYNLVRLVFTTIAALILGTVFWDIGSKRTSSQDLITVMGALYSACLFLGVSNASSVQPVVSIERTVFYREKAAGMYAPIPYAAAQGLVEVPYILTQTILYGVITYFTIGFERTLSKFVLYLVFMFLTFTYFTFYGMMAVGFTPNQHLAANNGIRTDDVIGYALIIAMYSK
ncbi:PREDICTED: ABC transporter G family member 31-like [Camelina sativa]|uniref:ABC transporter G family member 31-like n=1 Tax=Camelina sativa TaxID=90675 RepID=A0ABM0WP34_CAMSA|nr:PREDICTED: ABC transporter G family member 31-like [Camelina sativa]